MDNGSMTDRMLEDLWEEAEELQGDLDTRASECIGWARARAIASEEDELTAEEHRHVAGCPHCQRLLEAFGRVSEEAAPTLWTAIADGARRLREALVIDLRTPGELVLAAGKRGAGTTRRDGTTQDATPLEDRTVDVDDVHPEISTDRSSSRHARMEMQLGDTGATLTVTLHRPRIEEGVRITLAVSGEAVTNDLDIFLLDEDQRQIAGMDGAAPGESVEIDNVSVGSYEVHVSGGGLPESYVLPLTVSGQQQ